MDKNSSLGFILIIAVMLGFFYFNQADPQQIEAQKRYQDSIAAVQYEQELLAYKETERRQAELATLKNDSTSLLFNALKGEEQFVTLSNNKVNLRLSTLGGRVCEATLNDYNNQQGKPVTLFNEKLPDVRQ